FSPAVFYRSALGAFSASAGSLAVLGVVALLAAGALWRRGLERRWWHLTGAALPVLAAPYLVRYLGRGISPLARGAGLALWRARRPRWSHGVPWWRAASGSPNVTRRGWVAPPTPPPYHCSSASDAPRPPWRPVLPASSTRGGSPRRSRRMTTPRPSPCGPAPASPRPRSDWRASTCRPPSSRRSFARPRLDGGVPAWSAWIVLRACTMCS